MEKKFFSFCCAIIDNESFALYSAIADFFKEYGYLDGYINTLQAIYDLTQNNSYLLKIADYFQEKGYKDVAHSYYCKYFKANDCNLYEKYEQTKPCAYPIYDNRIGFDNNAPLIKLVDKNVLLVHLLHFGLEYGLVDAVLELSENLFSIAEKINNYLDDTKSAFPRGVYDIQEIVNDYNFLSDSLAKIKHHNDINKLAIRLNPENKLAYFNIMDDFIVYNNPQAAINFYNDVYRNQFNSQQAYDISHLQPFYKFMQNNFKHFGDYYKVAYYQKLIIELQLKV